jgi:predicted esterase
MKRTFAAAAIMGLLFAGVGHPLQEKKDFSSYSEMRDNLLKYYQQKRFREAADLIERHMDRFPENRMANSYNLALVCLHLEEYEKSLRVLMDAVHRGLWFGKHSFEDRLWEPLKKLAGFAEFQRANEALIDEARKKASPRLEVVKPRGFVEGRSYPLFLAIHGGNSNVEEFRAIWTSETLRGEFLVAYPQSSQVWAEDRFSWHEDMDLAVKEIREAFRKTMDGFPADPGEILVGGFSAGGEASLELVLSGAVPARGFIVLCPAKPKSFSLDSVRKAAGRGVRGVLLTTEFDSRIDEQKEMAEIMNREGLPVEVIVTPDLGHWFPDDLDKQIERALVFILEKRAR